MNLVQKDTDLQFQSEIFHVHFLVPMYSFFLNKVALTPAFIQT